MQNKGFVIEPNYLRKVVIKMYWDDSSAFGSSAIGDFFEWDTRCVKLCFNSAQMSPQDGKGFNCWWPMPFNKTLKSKLLMIAILI